MEGTPTDRLLGYRCDRRASSSQIPFQVDEVFTRYLNNDASGFGDLLGTDKHTTYAYDREGFRFTENGAARPAASATQADGEQAATDPVKGLDTNDELAFMATDAGPLAPARHRAAAGHRRRQARHDHRPDQPGRRAALRLRHARRRADGPKPGVRRHQRLRPLRARRERRHAGLLARRATATTAPAKQGPYCTPDGKPVLDDDGTPQDRRRAASSTRHTITTAALPVPLRRPLADDARSTTSPDGGKVYGPDLVDRWKARAFAQDPGSKTPCCGYEEEDTNWGGSSSLLGERIGPVRAIRETWGADSGTNVIRRETFYRERMVQKTWLRVHVIPPLDGIYAQWDFNAGPHDRVLQLRTTRRASPSTAATTRSTATSTTRATRAGTTTAHRCSTRPTARLPAGSQLCRLAHQEHASIDPGDATFADANAVAGLVADLGPLRHDRRPHPRPDDRPDAGRRRAQSMAAVPYYRDDACFDDGTGSDPGPACTCARARADDGARRHAAALLEPQGRRPARRRPGTETTSRARSAPTACTSFPGRLRQRPPAGAADRDRQRLGHGHAAAAPDVRRDRADQRRRALRPRAREAARRRGDGHRRLRSLGGMDYAAVAAGLQQAVPFNAHLGLEVLEVGPGLGVVRLPEAPGLLNHVGSQHAGGAVHRRRGGVGRRLRRRVRRRASPRSRRWPRRPTSATSKHRPRADHRDRAGSTTPRAAWPSSRPRA